MEIIHISTPAFKIENIETQYLVNTHRCNNIDTQDIYEQFKNFMLSHEKNGFTKCYLYSMWTQDKKEYINPYSTVLYDQLWIRCKFFK